MNNLKQELKTLICDTYNCQWGEDIVDDLAKLFEKELIEAYSKGFEFGVNCLIKIGDSTVPHPWNHFIADRELKEYLTSKGL